MASGGPAAGRGASTVIARARNTVGPLSASAWLEEGPSA
jgi:hypothetical protein